MLVCSRTRMTLKYILLSERNQTPKIAYDVTSLLSPSGPGQVVTTETHRMHLFVSELVKGGGVKELD